jgi:hypothetical protein
VSHLERQLADPTLYDGGAAGARRATELTLELREAKSARDQVLARWAEVAEAL